MTLSYWPQQPFVVSAWMGLHPTFAETVLDRPSGHFTEGVPAAARTDTHRVAGLVLVIHTSRV